MRFQYPMILYAIWGVALPGLFLWWAMKKKQRQLERFAQGPLLSELAPAFEKRRQIIKSILILFVFIFSIVALARPQWGFELQEVKRQGLDILFVIDTSRSMLTEDIKPNRLERTKLAVKDFLKKLRGDRVGLIAFSGDAFLVCPLTIDYNGFLLSLDDLDTATIPRGGTNLAAAIKEAGKKYDETPSQYKVVIILTDGDNLEDDPLPLAEKAKQQGIKIYSVGIGTQEGELIRVQNESGEYEFLKDENGNFVKSRLNEKLLQQIALTTGGVYVRASGAQFGLDLIYDQELSKLEKHDLKNKMEKKYFERFQFPLGVAFILLLAETCLPTRKERKDP